ncbi:MAG: HlyD family efflux transporter periplasmic adaptor subunit [Thermoguttaceae bacterium]|nr:HlyD family efflux transporter periplasmic adaptor subunit [Thermoguttaceae bacterium]MDW8038507.1 HlyD family efflux transporter periplasmic adaptor subunit [Thermoguttaceae bacterium]
MTSADIEHASLQLPIGEGFARRWGKRLVWLGAAGLVVGLGGWWLWPHSSWPGSEEMPIMVQATRGSFVHKVTERGAVESASNYEVRCEVQSRGAAGTMILDIVPEGTYVNEGDFLVRLDSSWLESEKTKQEITCAQSEALLAEAENALETARINLKEYLEGQYRLEEKKIQNEILLASQEVSRSRENLAYSERLAAKGYITKQQLEAETFALQKAQNELEAAQLKLKVLQEYTKPKRLKELESEIKTAEARLAARRQAYELDRQQLRRIEEQIAKCVIYAERAGEVVYANVTGQGAQDVIIEPGTLVRENQVIIRLPDPKNMQVKARVNETRISRIRVGMPAEIRLDAFPEALLQGEVTSVSEYPAPTMWHRGDVKEYETFIKILTPMEGLKPGLTAQVHIRVEELQDVLQLPIQAVFEHQGRYYCVVRNGQLWEARQVQIGPSNEQSVVIWDLLELPVPVVFQFSGRAFLLERTEHGWQSRQVTILSEVGQRATLRVPDSSLPIQAPSVFEYQGKPVRLAYDGQQWGVQPAVSSPAEEVEEHDSRLLPIQAVFVAEGRHYVLESDPAVWQALGTGETVSARVQSWIGREVQVGSDPLQPGRPGLGLRSGEEVVLHAAAYRDKVSLPDLPPPGEQLGSAVAKPERTKSKPKTPPSGAKQNPAEMFRKLDRNNDQRLSRDELPEPLRLHFTSLDKDEDGTVSLSEWVAGRALLRPKQQAKEPPEAER